MNEKKAWVDFKAIKAVVTIEMVLDHYCVTDLKRVKDELRGPCPIHGGSRASRHLSVNLVKGAFKCFASNCGAHGNVLDFVAAMEKCSVRDAAMKLQEWFNVGESQSSDGKQSVNVETWVEVPRGIYSRDNVLEIEVIATARTVDDPICQVVVYRELFGNYQYCVSPLSDFIGDDDREGKDTPGPFALIKAL